MGCHNKANKSIRTGGLIYEKIGSNLVFYIKGILLFALTSFVCYIYYKNIKFSRKSKRILMVELITIMGIKMTMG